MHSMEQLRESAQAIRARIGDFRPEVLLILGSGLSAVIEPEELRAAVPYEEIPHFPQTTAPGHVGLLVFGRLRGRRVAVMRGRFHFYEGYSPDQLAFAVRVLRLLGAESLIVTNAAGAVNTAFSVGQIMLITDQLMLFPCSPLRGGNLDDFGPRFPDASRLYTPELRELARQCAAERGLRLNEGVYMFFPGPQFETPAEIRAARVLGADHVGMSTAPEVIAAAHCGMRVLGFSLATNMAAGILDRPLEEGEVERAAAQAREDFSGLILACLERMG